MNRSTLKNLVSSRAGLVTGATVLAAAVTAAWVEAQARRAERHNPPTGRFVEIDGVRLHYVERGEGPPVVLIHGNTVSLLDFEASGLIDRLAANHRVIAFDRPGFGHSTRPRDRLWTPSAQADLLHAALARLGVAQPVVVGHSMGSMVAMALALNHPADVRSVVVLGGYYYSSLRVDALMMVPVALPVLGDVMRYTVTALSGRLAIKTLVKGMFAPREVPQDFFPVLSREMMVRPVQIRANAEDAAFMMPEAQRLSARLAELRLPVAIIAGADDIVIDPEEQTSRLHREMPHSTLVLVPGAGHMVHYAAPQHVVAAVERHLLSPRGFADAHAVEAVADGATAASGVVPMELAA
jgi:pimeloyl-ACP methyl ester carboxylesterase